MTYARPFELAHRPSSFPNASLRTFVPKVLQVVHVTGNSRVAAYPEGFDAGESPGADWLYAGRNPQSADGPSAHDYIGRKTGATIQMWDPRSHVAWSNGDLERPNTKLAGVRYLVDLRARGINANRGCYREIELSGYPGSFDPTDAQLEACAYFAAVDSLATGLDIIRGQTILTHADINSVDRANCAFRPAIREARLAFLIRRAIDIRDQLDLSEDPMSTTTITVLPFGGRFSIPAGTTVNAFKLDGPGGTVGTRKTFGPLDRSSGAEYDATMVTDPAITRGGPFIRVSTGALAGFYVAASVVDEVENTAPAVDCGDQVQAELERAADRAHDAVLAK